MPPPRPCFISLRLTKSGGVYSSASSAFLRAEILFLGAAVCQGDGSFATFEQYFLPKGQIDFGVSKRTLAVKRNDKLYVDGIRQRSAVSADYGIRKFLLWLSSLAARQGETFVLVSHGSGRMDGRVLCAHLIGLEVPAVEQQLVVGFKDAMELARTVVCPHRAPGERSVKAISLMSLASRCLGRNEKKSPALKVTEEARAIADIVEKLAEEVFLPMDEFLARHEGWSVEQVFKDCKEAAKRKRVAQVKNKLENSS